MRAQSLAGGLGLIPTAAVACWWLAAESHVSEAGSILIGSSAGTSAVSASISALEALWLCQLLTVVLFGPRLGLALGSRQSTRTLVCALALACPLLALLWSATFVGAGSVLLAEAALALLASALSSLGGLLRRFERTQRPGGDRPGGGGGLGGGDGLGVGVGLNSGDGLGGALALGSTLCAAALWWSRELWLTWLIR